MIRPTPAPRKCCRRFPISRAFSTAAAWRRAPRKRSRKRARPGQIKIIGMDLDGALLDLIEKGKVQGTMAQGAWNMGYWGLMMSYAVAHNMVDAGHSGLEGRRRFAAALLCRHRLLLGDRRPISGHSAR